MSVAIRAVISHLDANGKTLTQFGTEQVLLSVATVDEAGIRTALSNNSRLRGARVQVHCYANLDKQHQSATNLLS
jgi:hypothetical protein